MIGRVLGWASENNWITTAIGINGIFASMTHAVEMMD